MSLRIPGTRSLAIGILVIYVVVQATIILQHEKSISSLGQPEEQLVTLDYFSGSVTKGNELPPKLDLQKEIEKGLDYAKSIPHTKRRLLFVHIPKTAGTTIEEVGGLQARIPWGSCLFNHKPKRRGGVCQYPPGQFEWPMRIGYWHLPTQLFPLMGVNPYKNADLFAVVRDPYDRLLSEFYYICRRKITKWWDEVDCNRTRIQEPDYMNEWIQHKLQPTSSSSYQRTPKEFLDYNGHFTPQYDFLVSRPGGIRMVDYVLRMDNLNEEFAPLMEAYGISAEMLPHKKNVARNDTNDLDTRHFDATTWDLIRTKYGHDVEAIRGRDPT